MTSQQQPEENRTFKIEQEVRQIVTPCPFLNTQLHKCALAFLLVCILFTRKSGLPENAREQLDHSTVGTAVYLMTSLLQSF